MPIDYKKYGKDFVKLSKKLRSYGRCAFCGAENLQPNPRTGSKVVLTVHHLDKDIKNNSILNLVPLCQQCHFAANISHAPWFSDDSYKQYESWLWEDSGIFDDQEQKAK